MLSVGCCLGRSMFDAELTVIVLDQPQIITFLILVSCHAGVVYRDGAFGSGSDDGVARPSISGGGGTGTASDPLLTPMYPTADSAINSVAIDFDAEAERKLYHGSRHTNTTASAASGGSGAVVVGSAPASDGITRPTPKTDGTLHAFTPHRASGSDRSGF